MEMKLHVWLPRGKVDHGRTHVGSQNRVESLGVIAIRLISQFTLFVMNKPPVGRDRKTTDVIADSNFIESFEPAVAEGQVESLAGSVLVSWLSWIGISIVDIHAVTFS